MHCRISASAHYQGLCQPLELCSLQQQLTACLHALQGSIQGSSSGHAGWACDTETKCRLSGNHGHASLLHLPCLCSNRDLAAGGGAWYPRGALALYIAGSCGRGTCHCGAMSCVATCQDHALASSPRRLCGRAGRVWLHGHCVAAAVLVDYILLCCQS